jgi:hypothetical protein
MEFCCVYKLPISSGRCKVPSYTHTYVCMYKNTHTHTQTHTQIYMYIRIHACTYKHTARFDVGVLASVMDLRQAEDQVAQTQTQTSCSDSDSDHWLRLRIRLKTQTQNQTSGSGLSTFILLICSHRVYAHTHTRKAHRTYIKGQYQIPTRSTHEIDLCM